MISVVQNLGDDSPEPLPITNLGELEAVLRGEADDGASKLWIPAETSGLTDAHVKAVDFLALDFDRGEPDWTKLAGFAYVAHTTRSHKPEAPRWRVVVALEEPAQGESWKARYREWVRRHDFACPTDPKTCNPARKWFFPPAAAEWRTNDGVPARLPTLAECPAEDSRARFETDDALLRALRNEDSAVIEAAQAYLRSEAPKPPEHEGGNNSLFEVARVLVRSFCLVPELAEALITDYRAEYWTKPAQPGDVRRAIDRALSIGVDRPGARLLDVAGAFERVTHRQEPTELAAQPDPKAAALQAEYDAGYAALFEDLSIACYQLQPPDYVCQDLRLARSKDGIRPAALVAYANTGKTTALASIAIAAATGGRVFGQFPTRPDQLRVAILDNDGPASMKFAIREICDAQKIAVPPINFAPLKVYFNRDSAQYLPRIFREHDLVLIDSLKAMQPGADENLVAFADPLQELMRWSAARPTACVIARHSGKGDAETKGAQAGRGSSAIDGFTSVQWLLTPQDDSVLWTCIRKNDVPGAQPGQFSIGYDQRGNFTWEPGARTKLGQGLMKKRLLDLLAREPDRWYTISELVELLEASKRELEPIAQRLANEKEIGRKQESRQVRYTRSAAKGVF